MSISAKAFDSFVRGNELDEDEKKAFIIPAVVLQTQVLTLQQLCRRAYQDYH